MDSRDSQVEFEAEESAWQVMLIVLCSHVRDIDSLLWCGGLFAGGDAILSEYTRRLDGKARSAERGSLSGVAKQVGEW